MNTENTVQKIAVIGAGTMGQGIAQLALQAGHAVTLIDQSQEQLDNAKASLEKLFNRFAEKGKITAEQAQTWLDQLGLSTDNQSASDAGLVIEAIVERLDVKQAVFSALEDIVSDDTILASNTSSLSVTAIASALRLPSRFIGLHFFNPPGIMPLVEVVKAVQSDDAILDQAQALMSAWGKTPVRCKDTPSFIVNRVARPYYIESFRLLEEGAIGKEDLDACLRSGMNFRMGPCELTDFIGHDVNYAVSQSLWQALGYPPHLKPSFLQGELVAANYLGRKKGRGFYQYEDGKRLAEDGQTHNQFVAFAEADNPDFADDESYVGTLENGVVVLVTEGFRAADTEDEMDAPIALIDISAAETPACRAITYSPAARELMGDAVPDPAGLTERWVVMPDRPGLVNLRVISLIVNEGATAVLHGIADEAGVDAALKGGVNYPQGAFEWLDDIGIDGICDTLEGLGYYYGSHYMPSPYLKDKLELLED
ncbi:MAG: 3-hydroxyacyl-CoA dehydrogenase [Gammaproteobacteria bacterium]|nr:MAG: 3-hydroxyacyl-CoA dehydrogenase [Gammaproteobacteria bacterium]